jgi:hypothetical protein
VLFDLRPLLTLVTFPTSMAGKSGCGEPGSKAATSAGTISLARYGNRSMWLCFISASKSRMYWVPISEGSGQCSWKYERAIA